MKLDLNEKTVNYEINGRGEPVLLVHGWGGSSKSLQALARLLSEKFRTITLDLPGSGLSSKPDPDWAVGEYAKFLINIIDNLKIKPVVFFGHSFGGALGIYIAANYPTYIKKLVLSGASYKRSPTALNAVSKFFKWLPLVIKKIIYRFMYPQSDLYKVPDLEANFRKIVSQDLTSFIPSVRTPTLILWGEDDLQTPVEHARELNNKLQNSRLKIFPEIGHNLPLKYPELVYSAIKKFI